MSLVGFVRSVVGGRYYTRHPVQLAGYAYARWKLRPHNHDDARVLLRALDVDPGVLEDAAVWRPLFEQVTTDGRWYLGYPTGVTLERGLALYGIVRALKPERVVETGMASGVATTFLSAALVDNGSGTLYSIELTQEEAARRFERYRTSFDPRRGPGWAIPREIREAMGDRHVVILEDVTTSLPALLERLGAVDVFLHDDLHTPKHMRWELELVWPGVSRGGVLACDDVEYSWVRFCRRIGLDGLDNVQGLAAVRKP